MAIIFAFGYHKGYSNQKRAYDAYKAQIEARSAEQERKNIELAKKQQYINENLEKGYKDAIKKLDDYYKLRSVVRLQPSVSKTMSEVSNTTSTLDGKTKSDQIDPSGTDTLDCASDVLQLLYLQKWIEDQLLVQ
jgi:hypothetical protein